VSRYGAKDNGASVLLPCTPPDEQERSRRLSLTVVFTTVSATLAALRRAGELAQGLNAHIRIVVPQVVPYPLPLDRPSVDPEFTVRYFRTVSLAGSAQTRIDVRLCRDRYLGIAHALYRQSVVLIGGRKRRAWPTREHRLAKKLRLAGHHVIFVVRAE